MTGEPLVLQMFIASPDTHNIPLYGIPAQTSEFHVGIKCTVRPRGSDPMGILHTQTLSSTNISGT